MNTKPKLIVLSSAAAAMLMTSACSIIAKNPAEREEAPISTAQAAPQPEPAAQASTGEMALQKIDELENMLHFETGSATLKPEASQSLAELGQVLAQDPNLKIRVDGYTDATGSTKINQRLSQERADSVSQVLESQGVAPSQVVAEGHGKKHPLGPNETAEGRAENRRVTLALQ